MRYSAKIHLSGNPTYQALQAFLNNAAEPPRRTARAAAVRLFRVGIAEGTDLVDGERSHLMKLFINFAAEDCASWRMIASVLVGA